jgi:hypothetical protein
VLRLTPLNVIARKRPPAPVAPTPRRRSRMIRDRAIVADELSLLTSVRELYSRIPEGRTLEPYELQGTLWLLHYTNGLAPEAEIAAAVIAAAVEVARGD